MKEKKTENLEGKKQERHANDHYVTPQAIADFAVEYAVAFRKKKVKEKVSSSWRFLEPGCGEKAPFTVAAMEAGMDCCGVEIMDIDYHFGDPFLNGENVKMIGSSDFLGKANNVLDGEKFDIIGMNPPFKLGIEFIQKSLGLLHPTGVMCVLQKLSFMATQKRYEFFREFPPAETHILVKRPSFTGSGTDAQEYAIYFWVGSELAAKIRNKRGIRSVVKWQDNREWGK